MTLDLSQGVLQRRVFNQGVYEQHSKNFMLGQTAKYIHPHKNVIDVGAAVGMYSHFWANLCNHLFAFEAVPPVYEQLLKEENKHTNMTAYNKAVGSFCGTADFYVDDKRLSNSSFRNLVGGQKIEVEVVTLDSMNFNDVCFIKIDVEGHELDVLKGAAQLIEDQHPTIMCEVYPKFNNGPVANTFDFLFSRGYKCFYNVRGKGLHQVVDTADGVHIASDEKLIASHDGDFLFVYGD